MSILQLVIVFISYDLFKLFIRASLAIILGTYTHFTHKKAVKSDEITA